MIDRSNTSRQASRPPGPLRRWTKRILLLVAAAVFALALTEAALWLFAPIPFDEWMVYVPDGRIRARAEPHQVVRTAEGATVRINSLGFRGPEYAWKPAPGTLRIAVFGGSSTFCWQNSSEETTWPAQLQHDLSEALKMPVEVINLGLPGFDATQSKTNYMFLGRALHPDVVIEYDGWNDMKYFRMLERAPDTFTRWVPNKPWWQKLARSTQIGRRARNAYWKITLRKLEVRFSALEKAGVAENNPVGPEALSWARKNFEDFTTLANSDGVLPVLVTQGHLIDPANRGRKGGYDEALAEAGDMMDMSFPVLYQSTLELNRIVKDVAAKSGAILVDCYGVIPHDFENYVDSVHFNDKGSAALARLITNSLVADSRFQAVVQRVRQRATSKPAG